MAKGGSTETSQHIRWHPRGRVAQATSRVKQQALEEQGLGTRASGEGKHGPCQGARPMQRPQPVACSTSLPQNLK